MNVRWIQYRYHLIQPRFWSGVGCFAWNTFGTCSGHFQHMLELNSMWRFEWGTFYICSLRVDGEYVRFEQVAWNQPILLFLRLRRSQIFLYRKNLMVGSNCARHGGFKLRRMMKLRGYYDQHRRSMSLDERLSIYKFLISYVFVYQF